MYTLSAVLAGIVLIGWFYERRLRRRRAEYLKAMAIVPELRARFGDKLADRFVAELQRQYKDVAGER